MSDIAQEVQEQVARIREMMTETTVMFPNRNINFSIYNIILNRAEKAIREQDAVSLVKLLPELQGMD